MDVYIKLAFLTLTVFSTAFAQDFDVHRCDLEVYLRANGNTFNNCTYDKIRTLPFAKDPTCNTSTDISDELKECLSKWRLPDGSNADADNISLAFSSGIFDACAFKDVRLMAELHKKQVCSYVSDPLAPTAIMMATFEPHNVTEENLKHIPCEAFALFKMEHIYSWYENSEAQNKTRATDLFKTTICQAVLNHCTGEVEISKRLFALGDCMKHMADDIPKADPRMRKMIYEGLKDFNGMPSKWSSDGWRMALNTGCDTIESHDLEHIENPGSVFNDNKMAFQRCIVNWVDSGSYDKRYSLYKSIANNIGFANITNQTAQEYCGMIVFAPLKNLQQIPQNVIRDGLFQDFEECIPKPEYIPRENLMHIFNSQDEQFFENNFLNNPDIMKKYLRFAINHPIMRQVLEKENIKNLMREVLANISTGIEEPWTREEVMEALHISGYNHSIWESMDSESLLSYKFMVCSWDREIVDKIPQEALNNDVVTDLLPLISKCHEGQSVGNAIMKRSNYNVDFKNASCMDLRHKYSAVLRIDPVRVMNEISMDVLQKCMDLLVETVIESGLQDRIAPLISKVVNILPSIIKDGCTGEVDIGDFLDYIPLDALPEISQDACHEFQIHKWDRVSCKTGKLTQYMSDLWMYCNPDVQNICGEDYNKDMVSKSGSIVCDTPAKSIPLREPIMNKDCWDEIFMAVSRECAQEGMLSDYQAHAWAEYMYASRQRQPFVDRIKDASGEIIGRLISMIGDDKRNELFFHVGMETVVKWMSEVPIEFWTNVRRTDIEAFVSVAIDTIAGDNSTRMTEDEMASLRSLICFVHPENFDRFPFQYNLAASQFKNCPFFTYRIMQEIKDGLNIDFQQLKEGDICELAPLLLTVNKTEVEKINDEELCPNFEKCIGGTVMHQLHLTGQREMAGVDRLPEEDGMKYMDSFRNLTMRCWFKGQNKSEGPLKPTCDGIRTTGELGLQIFQLSDLKAMDMQEIGICVHFFAQGVFSEHQEDLMLELKKLMKQTYGPDLSVWPEDDVAGFGNLAARFEPHELVKLPLRIETLARWSMLDVKWSIAQLMAGLHAVIGKNNNGSDLNAKDIMSLGQFACGLNTMQISAIRVEDFNRAKDALGSLKCWKPDQLEALFRVYEKHFGGNPSKWDPQVIKAIGNILGGAPVDKLAKLESDQIRELNPDVIASIPASKINIFTADQFRQLSDSQINRITPEQFAKLDEDKRTIIESRVARKDDFKDIDYENEHKVDSASICSAKSLTRLQLNNCTFERLDSLPFARDPSCKDSLEISDEMKECISVFTASDGSSLYAAAINDLFNSSTFDVCAFDNRFMHETYRTMACAWDKNEDAVSATVTLMDNPYDVTEEILDEIPCMLFSFFSVSKMHEFYRRQDIGNAADRIRTKICLDVLKECSPHDKVLKRLMLLGQCASFMPDAIAHASPRIQALVFSALQDFKGNDVAWDENDWKSALSAGCQNIDALKLEQIYSLDIFGQNHVYFANCLKEWKNDNLFDKRYALYRALARLADFAQIEPDAAKQYCKMIVYAPIDMLRRVPRDTIRNGIFEVFHECMPDPLPMGVPRENLNFILNTQPKEFYDIEMSVPTILIRYLRSALQNNMIYESMANNEDVTHVLRTVLGNITRNYAKPWTRQEALQTIHIGRYTDETWANVTADDLMDFKILLCALDRRVLNLMPVEAFSLEVLNESLDSVRQCDVQDDMDKAILMKVPGLNFTNATCQDLKENYPAILRTDPIRVIRNIPQQVAVECIDFLAQSILDRPNMQSDDVAELVWKIKGEINVVDIIKSGCGGRKDIGDFITYLPQSMLPPISNDTCESLAMNNWPDMTCKAGRWTRYMTKLWKHCRPDFQEQVCSPGYNVELATRSGWLICDIRDIPEGNVNNTDCWDDIFLAVNRECEGDDTLSESQVGAWAKYLYTSLKREEFLLRLRELASGGRMTHFLNSMSSAQRLLTMETVGLSAMIKWLKDVPVEFWASFPKRSVQDFINMAVKGIMSGGQRRMTPENVFSLGSLICYINLNHIEMFPYDLRSVSSRFNNCPFMPYSMLKTVRQSLKYDYRRLNAGDICEMGPLILSLQDEAERLDPEQLCPDFRKCVTGLFERQGMLTALAAQYGAEHIPEKDMDMYYRSYRALVNRCIFKHDPYQNKMKRDIHQRKLTCGGIQSVGITGLLTLTAEEMSAMDDQEFFPCLFMIKQGRYLEFQRDVMKVILQRMKNFMSYLSVDFSQWPADEVDNFGNLISVLSVDDLEKLPLKLSTLSRWSTLDVTLTKEQLAAAVESVFGLVDGSSFSPFELISMSKFACGLTVDQINAVNESIYDSMKDAVGLLSCWDPDQQEAWFAKYRTLYMGDPKMWSPDNINALGTVIGGAPGDALIALNAEQIRSIQPYVVATIPAAKFNNLTEEQLAHLTEKQANKVTEEQVKALDNDKEGTVLLKITRVPPFLRDDPRLNDINECDPETDIKGIDFKGCSLKKLSSLQFAKDRTCQSSKDISDEVKECLAQWEIGGENAQAESISNVFISGLFDACAMKSDRLMFHAYKKVACAYMRNDVAVMDTFRMMENPDAVSMETLAHIPCAMISMYNVQTLHEFFKRIDIGNVADRMRTKICTDVLNRCTSEDDIIKRLLILGDCVFIMPEAFAKADPRLKALMYSALKEIKGDNVPWTSGDWRSALSAGCDHLDNRRMANIESLEIVGENIISFQQCVTYWVRNSMFDKRDALFKGITKHVDFSQLTSDDTKAHCDMIVYAPVPLLKKLTADAIDGIFDVFFECMKDPLGMPRPNLLTLLNAKPAQFYQSVFADKDVLTLTMRIAIYADTPFNVLRQSGFTAVVREVVAEISRNISIPWSKWEAERVIAAAQYTPDTWTTLTNDTILDYGMLTCALNKKVINVIPESAFTSDVVERMLKLIKTCDEVEDNLVESLIKKSSSNSDIDFGQATCDDIRDKYAAVLKSYPQKVMTDMSVDAAVDCIDLLVDTIVQSGLLNRITQLIKKVEEKLAKLVKDGCSGVTDIGSFIEYYPQVFLPKINNETCTALDMASWSTITCKTGKWTGFMTKLWKFCRTDVQEVCGPTYKVEMATKSGGLICGLPANDIPQGNINNTDCWDEVYMAVIKQCSEDGAIKEPQERAWAGYIHYHRKRTDFVDRIKEIFGGSIGRFLARLSPTSRDEVITDVGHVIFGKWLSEIPIQFWTQFPPEGVEEFVSVAITGVLGNSSKMTEANVVSLGSLICYVNTTHFELFPADYKLAASRFKDCPRLKYSMLQALKSGLSIDFSTIDAGDICELGPILRAVTAEEAEQMNGNDLCPVFKSCVGESIERQSELSKLSVDAGAVQLSANETEEYKESGRDLAKNCLYKADKRRRRQAQVVQKPTCNGINIVGPTSVLSINADEFNAMDTAEFLLCIDPIGRGKYSADQTDVMQVIITRMKTAGIYDSDLSAWPSDEVADFGTIASQFTEAEIKALPLDSESLAKWTTLDTTWTNAQLKAGLESVYGAGKDGSTFSTDNLMSMGQFACGLTLAQIGQVNTSVYDEAKDAMGALSCWSQDQQSAWFATYQIIYGDDPSAWDDEVTAGLGTVLGGAPAETLAQLSPEQMQNMEPDVVASIPPESFNAFSADQLGELGDAQSNLISVDQINALDDSKQSVVEDKISKSTTTKATTVVLTAPITTIDPNFGLGNNGAGNVKVSAVLSTLLVMLTLLI